MMPPMVYVPVEFGPRALKVHQMKVYRGMEDKDIGIESLRAEVSRLRAILARHGVQA